MITHLLQDIIAKEYIVLSKIEVQAYYQITIFFCF